MFLQYIWYFISIFINSVNSINFATGILIVSIYFRFNFLSIIQLLWFPIFSGFGNGLPIKNWGWNARISITLWHYTWKPKETLFWWATWQGPLSFCNTSPWRDRLKKLPMIIPQIGWPPLKSWTMTHFWARKIRSIFLSVNEIGNFYFKNNY